MIAVAYTGSNLAVLLSGKELYGPSYMVGLKKAAFAGTTPTVAIMEHTLYGSTRNFWGLNNTAADADLVTSLWTHVVTVGTFKGKGLMTSINITATVTITWGTVASYTSPILSDSTYCASGLCEISAPTGGVGQF